MKKSDERTTPSIAVVGTGAIFPGELGRDGFWRDILAGRDNITDVPPSHWLITDYFDADPATPDKTYCKRGGFLSPVDFDPLEFGIPPTALPSTDTAQLLALVVAKQVLEEVSRTASGGIDKTRTSVVLGVASATEMVVHLGGRLQRPLWLKGLREAGVPEDQAQQICKRIAENYVPWQESSFPGMLGNVVAGRIANRLDLGGTNYVTDAACASSLSALQVALNELYLGQSDTVITGGVDALNDILMYMCFSKTPAFSPTGGCRPFSDKADGTIIGEGIGMLALRRLEDAERDGNSIYAVIRGLGSSSDGSSTSVYAPRPEGQAQALRRAYDTAGYGPGTVELMEAHGTATKAGDAAEFHSLRSVFEPDGAGRQQWCALGSIKSQIGHTKAAAGAAGLLKTVMALHHKVLPPTIKVQKPNPDLEISQSPFFINTKPRPWIRNQEHPRRASVSSFGFGGSNFHVTLEEYQGPGKRPQRTRAHAAELILLSAADRRALAARTRGLVDHCGEREHLAALARDSQLDFQAAEPHRLTIVASSLSDLAVKLEAAARALDAGEAPGSPDIAYGNGEADAGKTAFLFPGQGSQYVDMGAGLAIAFDAAREVWDRAADMTVFEERPLHRVVFPPPAFDDSESAEQQAAVTAMDIAQPAIAAVSLSQLAILTWLGLVADAVAGHSFGEVMALSAAGVFDEAATLAMAARRGRSMVEAAAGTEGAMTAVSWNMEGLAGIIDANGLQLVLANDNSPRQVVLSGALAEIERAEAILEGAGRECLRLPVATAFHSEIVAPSCQPFAEALRDIPLNLPSVPVYANATAAPYPGDTDEIRTQLADQLVRPVRFRQSIERMYADGVRTFIEVGPGAVLTALVGQCLEDRPHVAVSLDRKGQNGVVSLWRAIGRLAALGKKLDLAPLWANLPPATEEPKAPPAHAVRITGANFGKPYPPPGGAADLPLPNPSAEDAPPVAASGAVAGQSAPLSDFSQDGGRLQQFEAFQRQMAETHGQFQKSMAESHQAFLRMAERTLQTMAGQPVSKEGALTERQAMPSAPGIGDSLAMAAMETAPAPPLPAASETPAMPGATVAAPQPIPEQSFEPAPSAGAQEILLQVVGEKTGYPTQMLDLDMDLEAGLGIDSIKQVEILSALRDRLPDLPEIDPVRMADLRSLGAILAFIGDAAHETQAGSFPAQTASPPEGSTEGAADFETALLEVVAEKTGYPVEMLDLDMELEAGLGIDSIKQVEILSALRDRIPSLPEVQPADMAELKTLSRIVEFMNGAAPGGAPVEADKRDPSEQSTTKTQETPPETAPAQDAPLARYVPVCIDAPASGFAISGLQRAGQVAVTGGSQKLRDALVAELNDNGIAAQGYASPPADAGAVICLHGLAKSGGSTGALKQHLAAFQAARSVARHCAEVGGVFVTIQDTGGDFGLQTDPGARAWLGGFPGLVKTFALECPKCMVKAIDIERRRRDAQTLARAIVDELLAGGPEIEVGLKPGGRRVIVSLQQDSADGDHASLPLKDDAVVVVSGGGRGVTARAIERLAVGRRLKFLILGRTPLDQDDDLPVSADSERALTTALFEAAKQAGESPVPAVIARRVRRIVAAREIQATLDRLRSLGSEARYAAVDVTDHEAVAHAVDEARRDWAPVAALVHGAGVLADKRIAEKTDQQFDLVFKTKVSGLEALIQATADDPIRAICLFSSAAAKSGNPGQCDYAMANEVLNKVAQAEARRRSADCVVKAINWGPWDGGMVDDGLKAHFERHRIPLIALGQGCDFLDRELAQPCGSAVEVLAGSALAADDRPVRMELAVNGDDQPFLSNHRIKDKPVLPMVLVLEWFVRAARTLAPDLVPLAVRDLHVLKGVILDRYPETELFEITAKPSRTNGCANVGLELRSIDGRACYRATVELGLATSDGEVKHQLLNGDFGEWPWQADEVYQGKLFHGPDFQVIRELEGISEQGGVGVFEGTQLKNWPGGPWLTDPAALDGGMQLALLWALKKSDRMFLPICVGAFVPSGPMPAEGLLRCDFRSRMIDGQRTESDLTFATLDGEVVAEMRDVEMYPIDTAREGPVGGADPRGY